ncbi:septation protein IspZ [Croceibacterium sp. TMG7-5b_MA50]|uniref:septation protein IspZ n=1 Tax=Croceibacterium sp. TMG7-5b_MA50 TaxID=3121290 RepID=UPI0032218240
MNLTFARYRRPFTVDGIACEVVIRADFKGMHSELLVAGERRAADSTPAMGVEATRNHHLATTLPDGTPLAVEAGYINWVNVGIAVRVDGQLVHESHPGRRIAYPEKARKMAGDANVDMARYSANKVPLLVDIGLGILFYILAKLTDLTTAALAGAVIGLALVVVQRFVKVDLLGGLAMFGVVMLLLSAGLALIFQDDMAVKMRSTILGSISAILFLGDGLLGGNRLGKGLARYLPYTDLNPGRLAFGLGLLGLVMALLNWGVAQYASTDIWLFYSTFVDFILAASMTLLVFRYARSGNSHKTVSPIAK